MSEQKFRVGQKIDCMDGNYQKWYSARIKKVELGRVLVAWTDPRWRHPKYDQWVIELHYDIRIRRPEKQQNVYNQCTDVSEMKHVDDFNSMEFMQWICSLPGVSQRNQRQLMIAIQTEGVTGRDFNEAITVQSDVREVFPLLSKNGAKNIFLGLNSLRNILESYNIQSRTQHVVSDHHNLYDDNDIDNQEEENDEHQCSECVTLRTEKSSLETLINDLLTKQKQLETKLQQMEQQNGTLLKENINIKQSLKRSQDKGNQLTKDKRLINWTKNDVLQWISGMKLSEKWTETAIKGIENSQCNGNDLLKIKSKQDVSELFCIDNPMLAARIWKQLKDIK